MEYGELPNEVFNALNAPRKRRYEQEQGHLAPLPAFRFADYELLTVRVLPGVIYVGALQPD